LQWKLRAANHQAFQGQPVSAFFGNSIGHRWLKMLLMYSYSIPYQKIEQFPAEFAAFILQDAGIGTRWNRIVGGVYTYIDKILARFTGEVHCNVQIVDIARKPDGVLIKLQSGESLAFDKVVFATPPDQVLDLLSDPNDDEKRRFAPWRANRVTTVIHTDTSLYRSYGVRHYSEFDVFEKDGGRDAGYNAYLNQLCGLSDQDTAYQMAYNLTERIDSKKIVHTQDHNTPLYTVEAIRYRHEVAGTNGENHTYHAGAYLGNGLHEGAISSAVAVSKLLGGHLLW
jgi:predicted NAD/FAD-binding protein